MKLRERVIIFFSATFVLLTVLFVIDLQYDFGYGGQRLLLPTRHARIFAFDGEADGDHSIYRKFHGKFFAGSAPSADAVVTSSTLIANDTVEVHDSFTDLAELAFPKPGTTNEFSAESTVVYIVFENRDQQPRLSDVINLGSTGTLQMNFHRKISKRQMYNENDPVVSAVLDVMKTERIILVTEKEGGTQLKLIIHYENGDRALFKPMRFSREQQTLTNHFYFTDYERHNAEIAAFHLDKVLCFRRAMPVSGRILNLTTELYNVGEPELLKTFFISPANNYCFHGHCSYYCDTSHAVCGNPDMLEGSFAAFLPEKEIAGRTLRKHPWRRSYHKRKKAIWETDPNYCDGVRISSPYDKGLILLDLIDTCIFDFISGNMDRHHFETFTPFGNDTFPIHLDHGRAFGRPFHDELSILAPLTQCCMIKHETLARLLTLHNGPKKLSQLMRESMASDPVNPVLWEPHYSAMDRRVGIILQAVRTCVQKAVSVSRDNEKHVVDEESDSTSKAIPAPPISSS